MHLHKIIIPDDQTGLQGIAEVKSYNYKRLSVMYGPGYPSLVSHTWCVLFLLGNSHLLKPVKVIFISFFC